MIKEQEKKSFTLKDYCRAMNVAVEVRETSGRLSTYASGLSMYPTVRAKDKIIIDKIEAGLLCVGDIITFFQGDLLVCHRISEIKSMDGEKYFITKGDSHASPDRGKVSSSQIIGRVVLVERRGKELDPYKLKYTYFSRIYYQCRFSFYKTWLDAIRGFRIALSLVVFSWIYKYTLGWIAAKGLKKDLQYSFFLWNNQERNSIYRYLDIPLESILKKSPEFWAPLKEIGKFKIIINHHEKRAGKIKLAKLDDNDEWAIVGFSVKAFYLGVGIFDELFRVGLEVLGKLKLETKPLYVFVDRDDFPLKLFLKGKRAKLIKKYFRQDLYAVQ